MLFEGLKMTRPKVHRGRWGKHVVPTKSEGRRGSTPRLAGADAQRSDDCERTVCRTLMSREEGGR